MNGRRKDDSRNGIAAPGGAGFPGAALPRGYGGGGGDCFTDIVLVEDPANCGSFGVNTGVAVQLGMATPPILRLGTEKQEWRCLMPAAKGWKTACLGITEPEAGSDFSHVKTFAERVGGGWKVNGNKIFVTNGWRADFMTLLVRTDRERKGCKGTSIFLVSCDTRGFAKPRKLGKAGRRCSDTRRHF